MATDPYKPTKLNDAVYYCTTILVDPYLPSYVPMVKGKDYAVWVDSGPKWLMPELLATMDLAKVRESDLRFVVQTHSHADHIGCNVQLKNKTGCLIASPKGYAHWHSDPERHFQEWGRPIPELMPDTPELREGVFGWFDSPHKIDVFVDEPSVFDLGGGVEIESVLMPGHMKNDTAWFERSSKTLLMGDCITVTDWPHFHIHLTVPGYRKTIERVRKFIKERDVQTVVNTHAGVLTAKQTLEMADKSEAFLDHIDRLLFKVLASKEKVNLEEIWTTMAQMLEKAKDHQSLNSVNAHLEDFVARGLAKPLGNHSYQIGTARGSA